MSNAHAAAATQGDEQAPTHRRTAAVCVGELRGDAAHAINVDLGVVTARFGVGDPANARKQFVRRGWMRARVTAWGRGDSNSPHPRRPGVATHFSMAIL